jgi:hypothetical protein
MTRVDHMTQEVARTPEGAMTREDHMTREVRGTLEGRRLRHEGRLTRLGSARRPGRPQLGAGSRWDARWSADARPSAGATRPVEDPRSARRQRVQASADGVISAYIRDLARSSSRAHESALPAN